MSIMVRLQQHVLMLAVQREQCAKQSSTTQPPAAPAATARFTAYIKIAATVLQASRAKAAWTCEMCGTSETRCAHHTTPHAIPVQGCDTTLTTTPSFEPGPSQARGDVMQIEFVFMFLVQLSDGSHIWHVRVCCLSRKVLPPDDWVVNNDRRLPYKRACARAPAAAQCLLLLLLLTPPHCTADAVVAGRCITTSSSPAAILATTVPAAASNHRYLHQHHQPSNGRSRAVSGNLHACSAAVVKAAA